MRQAVTSLLLAYYCQAWRMSHHSDGTDHTLRILSCQFSRAVSCEVCESYIQGHLLTADFHTKSLTLRRDRSMQLLPADQTQSRSETLGLSHAQRIGLWPELDHEVLAYSGLVCDSRLLAIPIHCHSPSGTCTTAILSQAWASHLTRLQSDTCTPT